MKVEDFIVHPKSTIRNALELININGRGICFVQDSTGVVGALSDGDVRRYLLKNNSIDSQVEQAMNQNFVACSVQAHSSEIRNLFSGSIKILPLVNQDNCIVDFADVLSTHRLPVLEPEISGNELAYVTDCIETGWISSQGQYVKKFEEQFSQMYEGMQAIAVSNGTVALHLALITMGIKAGDEVIVPDLTFAATINSVIYCGATPVLCDVSKDTWCINPECIESLITTKTKAIIPVHLYGQNVNMYELCRIAKQYNLHLIEDCAESLGSYIKGAPTGSHGDVSTFSFFGNKTISTGEGGMVLFRSPQCADLARTLRDHGMSKSKRYWHEHVGFNYRMTNLQAAIGVAQMERLDKIVAKKREIRIWYNERLSTSTFINQVPFESEGDVNSNWLYTISLTDNSKRDLVIELLLERGIEARQAFYPLHHMPIYSQFGDPKKLANSTIISKCSLSLPTSVKLKNEDVSYICNSLEDIFSVLG